uniref:Uncharacterized protein n=1 Tax=Glossina pallidipes TaxID=7398 RepID=A0A1B0A7L9_GLOPL
MLLRNASYQPMKSVMPSLFIVLRSVRTTLKCAVTLQKPLKTSIAIFGFHPRFRFVVQKAGSSCEALTSKAVQFLVASSTMTGLPEHPFNTDSTCITYDAVNAAYLDARKRIHISQPKGDWKTEDIATVGELLLDISIQLARTCHSHVFMIFNCHDCMNNTTTSNSGSTSYRVGHSAHYNRVVYNTSRKHSSSYLRPTFKFTHVSMIQRFVVFSVIDDYSDDVCCDVMRYTTQKLHDD